MQSKVPNTHLFSYWDGPVSWLERLCIRSILDAGNTITIYSYAPENSPISELHTDVRDAREVIPEGNPNYRYIEAKRFALYANLFRLVGQMKGLGTWVDLDCYFVDKIEFSEEYHFGWSSDRKLNNAVLKLPTDSEMTKTYYAGISRFPLKTPWSTWRRRMHREFEILMGRDTPGIKTRTNIGPRALTYYAKRAKKIQHASPIDVYYPIPSKLAPILTTNDDREAHSLITENTKIVHAWQGKLKRSEQLNTLPPESSYFGAAWKKHNL